MDRLLTRMLRGIYIPRIEKRMDELGIDSHHLKDYVLDVVTGDVRYALFQGQGGLKIIAPNGERETPFSPKGASLIINGVKGYSFSDIDKTYESDLDPKMVDEILKEPVSKFLRIGRGFVKNALYGHKVLQVPVDGGGTEYAIYPRTLVPNGFIGNENERHDILINKFNEFAVSNALESVNGVSPKASAHYKNLLLGKAIEKAKESAGKDDTFNAIESEYGALKTSSLPAAIVPLDEVYKDAFRRASELIDEDFISKANYERERILGKATIGPVVAVRTPYGNVVHRISSREMKSVIENEIRGLIERDSVSVTDLETEYVNLVRENNAYSDRLRSADFEDGASFLSAELFFHLFEEELDRSLTKTYREIIQAVPEMKRVSYMSIFNWGHGFPKAHVEDAQKHVFETRRGLMEGLREYENTGSPDIIKSAIAQTTRKLNEGDRKLEKKLLKRGMSQESALREVDKVKEDYRARRSVKKAIDDLGKVFEGLDEHHFLSIAYVLS